MDDYLRAVILGLVQALSEFLPISSSGHLVLAGHVLGDKSNSLTFDVGLHVGTLVAVFAYFWREWTEMIGHGARDLFRHGLRLNRWDWRSQLLLWIAVGTLPAVVAGALFGDYIEANLRQAWLIALFLIVASIPLELADRLPGRRPGIEQVGPRDAVLIGLAQAVALMPGVSRSGATITASRTLGFDRATAARFSFLLSAPAVLGAATLKLSAAATGDEALSWGPLIVGAIVSGLAGAAVIHWLLRYLVGHRMRVFVWYRIVLGLVVLAVAAATTL